MVDDVTVRAIDRLSYDGPGISSTAADREGLLTSWRRAGPFERTDDRIARHPASFAPWSLVATDPRGAIVTGRDVDYHDPRTVAYYRATVVSPVPRQAELVFGTVGDLAVWINGRFEGFVPRQDITWFDVHTNPAHPGRRVPLTLRAGANDIAVRIRGGVYASGGLQPSGRRGGRAAMTWHRLGVLAACLALPSTVLSGGDGRVAPRGARFPPAVSLLLQDPEVTRLDSDQVHAHGVVASQVTYQGRRALRLIEPDADRRGGVALIPGVRFTDGTIEIDVAGRRGPFAVADDRGFIGLAFRVRPDAETYETFYIRPDNGRALDQVRRNHSTQYAARPGFDFARLRAESPERYESYVDLEPGAWTRLRIEVAEMTAQFYVHDAAQPVLVVNDLKLGTEGGGVGLWIGPGTEGYFDRLRIRHAVPK